MYAIIKQLTSYSMVYKKILTFSLKKKLKNKMPRWGYVIFTLSLS
jgi:hypothetical protein